MIQRYSVDDRMETMETMELMSMGGHQSSGGQTILTAAAKKQVCIYVFQFEFVFPLLIVFLYLYCICILYLQGLEALVLEQHDGGRVEVERIPELPHEQSQTVEIANVQVSYFSNTQLQIHRKRQRQILPHEQSQTVEIANVQVGKFI